MQPQKQRNTNIGVGSGALLQLAGVSLWNQTGNAAAIGGMILIGVSLPPFVWGCMNYAEGKGHSQWVGLAGLAGIIGLIVLILFPDQGDPVSVPRQQLRKLVGLISMAIGFGLAVLGLWLHHLGEDVRLERLLYPWPAVCMVAGAFLVVGSLVLVVRNGRR